MPSRHFINESCCHAEYRIQNSRNVKRLGISTISDLLLFNHAGFWLKRLCLFKIDTEKLGKLINRTHLNTRPRIIKRGRYIRNVDKFRGARVLRLCFYENDLMDSDMKKTGQVGQAQFTALKEHVKKYGLDLKLNKVLTKVDVTKLLENAEHPEVLARADSITM